MSDEDLQRLFEDLLDAKSEGPRTASAIVEEQVAAVEAEEDRPVTAWDDVSGSGRESLAFRTEAPSDPQPEDQGLRRREGGGRQQRASRRGNFRSIRFAAISLLFHTFVWF